MRNTLFILLSLLMLSSLQAQNLDLMTPADSGVYMFNPLPQGKDYRMNMASANSPLAGGLLVQQYVPRDTVTVYGVALTMQNHEHNGRIFGGDRDELTAVLMQRAADTTDSVTTWYAYRALEYVDSLSLDSNHIKKCLFQYVFDSGAVDTFLAPCYEFYFNTPMKMNVMTDTFYVGRVRLPQDYENLYLAPNEYCGVYDSDPIVSHYWYVGYPNLHQTYDYSVHSKRYWGYSFPIIGFRCKPLDEESHALALTNQTSDGATVRWYSVEVGATYNVRLYSVDGEVDTVAVTTDSSYTFSGLPQDKCYRVQVRKQCHYATVNYDTIVYSPWTVTPTSFILGSASCHIDTDTTGTGGDSTIVDTTHVDTTIVDTTGISVRLLERRIVLLPNPVSDQVRITSGYGLRHLEVYNAAGAKVQEQRATGYSAELDVSALPAGPYLVRIATPAGTVTKKLVVQRR